MSDPTYYTRLTDIGSAALNNAITGGASIALTELALGDANGASYDPDGAETTLVNEQYRLAISSITPDAQNPAWLIVEAIIPPDVGGWWIREAGIFDANGDMFAIAKYPETYKAVLSDGTASTLTIQIVLQVTNTDSIELVVNPLDGYATQGWVVSAYPWATEEEATNAQVENKLVDPKRLAYALSHLDLASGEDLLSLSQTLNQDLSDKADADHTHDDRYYTKSISDERFLEKGATAANAINATKLGGHLASFFAAAASLGNYYDKTSSDKRYLGKTAKAADSNKLDGKDSSAFALKSDLDSVVPPLYKGDDQRNVDYPIGSIFLVTGNAGLHATLKPSTPKQNQGGITIETRNGNPPNGYVFLSGSWKSRGYISNSTFHTNLGNVTVYGGTLIQRVE